MAAWKKIGMVSSAVLLGALAMPIMAQNAPAGGDGQGGAGATPAQPGGGGGGGAQPGGDDAGGDRRAQFRQQMADQLKKDLGATDDEFAALQPKIEAVMKDMRDANAGGGMFGAGGGRRRGGGGPNGGGANPAGAENAGGGQAQPQSPVQAARKDLQDALDNKDSTADQIKTKLDAYRDAKTKAKEELAKAQADLKGVLTQRQEAVLVLRGMLD